MEYMYLGKCVSMLFCWFLCDIVPSKFSFVSFAFVLFFYGNTFRLVIKVLCMSFLTCSNKVLVLVYVLS